MDFNKLIRSAQTSRFGLWKLNFLLKRLIPFNRPHGIKIIDLTANRVEVLLPMKNANLNHLKGLHACGLATAAEFSSGFLLLSRLGIENYRLIMQSLEVEYFYQGKTDARAIYELSDEELEEERQEQGAASPVAGRHCRRLPAVEAGVVGLVTNNCKERITR